MKQTLKFLALGLVALACRPAAAASVDLFARTNLVAWCIVPFDAKKRGPAERADMVHRLGFTKVAYDWRAEHVPTFEQEILAYKKHGLEYFAFWSNHDEAFKLFTKHGLHPQIWQTAPSPNAPTQEERVKLAAKQMLPPAERARQVGGKLGLYNHGGWGGEPENLVAVCRYLREQHGMSHAGIVYNLHHGHDHVDRFAEALALMKPYLLCLNLNGMTRDGEKAGKKILPLGQGELDLQLLRIIRDSGWRGPVGILGHTQNDVEEQLLDNLDGLEWLVKQLDGKPAGPKPQPRTMKRASASEPVKKVASVSSISQSLVTSAATENGNDTWAVEDAKEREKLPLYKTIPAAKATELTPANGLPTRETLMTWTRSHGGDGCERYSALAQVHRANVKQLEVAWTYHSGDGKGNIQCNPIVVNGVMFAPTVGEHLAAIDAATGVELWRIKPEGRPAFRGLTWWPGTGGAGERIFFPTEKNWLYAIDPKTGKAIEGFGSGGRVKLAEGARVAPVIFERTLVIAGYLKDVEAFDAVTGEKRWEFHTVPQAGEFGADTWSKPQANAANCWGGMALDTARGIAYITTGSPKPNFLGMLHRGDNLFANCVVALDARTGRRLWHFQEIRHDIWDLDIPAPPVLTTITRDGKKVDVVAAVSKIGNTLLLDRVTGKPIFPFRLRRAPVSTVPGELTAPYQPDVELPQPFARQNFTMADAPTRNEEVRDWAKDQLKSFQSGWFLPMSDRKVTVFYNVHGGAEWTGACSDPTTGRLYVTANQVPWYMSLIANDEPPENLKAPPTAGRKLYEQACLQCHGPDRNGVGVAPPLRGLRNRLKDADVLALLKTGRGLMPVAPPMSETDEKALLDYLFLRDRPTPVKTGKPDKPSFVQSGWNRFLDLEGYPACQPPWGTLNCIDLNTGKLVWQVPLGEYEELTKQGVPKTGTENFGGALVTAGGLVFCGGTRDGKIRAFDADTGAELWSAKLPWGGYAPPATYQVNGRQFIVIPATGGGKLGGPTGDAYVAFALPKK
ncbi:MAG: PQQ-binding-like beta-propeller repeat protein [Verrucomicrobiota bacterium]